MKGTRSLLLSCFLALALIQSARASGPNVGARAGNDLGSILAGDTTTDTKTTSATSASATSASQTSASNTSQTSATSATSASQTQSSQSATSDTASKTTDSAATTQSSQQQQQSQTNPPSQTVVTSTGSDGTVVVTQTLSTPTDSSTSASASATSGSDSNDSSNSSSGLGTGSIIGLSVAGGIAVLGIVAFFIWKFTRKRFSDFDDNEAIKWPELNAHSADGGDSHPLPVHNTGRAGFDTGSEVSLSRAPSSAGHTNFSTPDLGNDPYAVPPLPHLNPNQPLPYRDDPSAQGAYYDPYRGPVPGAFSEPGTATEWGPHPGEAIPMTQMGAVGPTGRASPGPSMMGRMSPGPGMAYDMGRGATPVPNMGRASPGPHAAYDNYGAR